MSFEEFIYLNFYFIINTTVTVDFAFIFAEPGWQAKTANQTKPKYFSSRGGRMKGNKSIKLNTMLSLAI